MEQGMAVYEGTYCELREPHCAACGLTKDDSSSSRLFQCSRCGVVHYCGVACQKQDFARHKKDCRDVQKCKDRMEKEAELLKHFSQWGEEPTNMFETTVGLFWVRFRLNECVLFGKGKGKGIFSHL
jgi:MYND finger